MYTIAKQFHFSAAHQLVGLPAEHPCSRLHGHNYAVEVQLQSKELTPEGFVRDYGDLDALQRLIAASFDHRNLNDIFAIQTSAENLAHYLYDWCKREWPETVAVRVSETPKTWAEYRP